jgi:hypothetical protein
MCPSWNASAKVRRIGPMSLASKFATTARRPKGGQFVTCVAALPGTPYDGHTLATVIPAIGAAMANFPPFATSKQITADS